MQPAQTRKEHRHDRATCPNKSIHLSEEGLKFFEWHRVHRFLEHGFEGLVMRESSGAESGVRALRALMSGCSTLYLSLLTMQNRATPAHEIPPCPMLQCNQPCGFDSEHVRTSSFELLALSAHTVR
jgi:hypothetical protein